MRLYLAHNFDARNYLNTFVKPQLENAGHEITSRWIWDDSHLEVGSVMQDAQNDLEDIEKAQGLILFVDQFADRPGRGKFAEFGYAIRAGKKVFIIGKDRSCVFYNLPTIIKFNTLDEFMESPIPH